MGGFNAQVQENRVESEEFPCVKEKGEGRKRFSHAPTRLIQLPFPVELLTANTRAAKPKSREK